MNAALELVTKLGPGRLAAMGAVALALVGFFAFVILRATQPAMGVLYADLSPQDSASVIRDLDTRGVRYEARGESGGTILAPRSDLARLRMDLAGKGLPATGGVGYEIFDKGDAFSSTSFVQGVNHLRAMEGELSRTIRSIGRVQGARVHLVVPERRLFARDREVPSASIALKLAGELDQGQVRAIRHLVASAVEGLRPERISIVDERGRLLADGARSDEAAAGMGLEERQAATERRLRGQVEEIVAGIVGSGRARIQVAADLDVNRVESRSETFDPESRVVRSTQTRSENQTTAGDEKGVSVGNELPGAGSSTAPGPKDASSKNEETTNYEISRTTRTEVLESGRVKRLSVAVVVDGVYTRGAPGTAPAYAPRPPEELERIAALVRSAIGFDKARGDQVEVVNLRFADPPVVPEFEKESLVSGLLSPTKEDVLRLVELGVLAALTLIVLLTVVRPLMRRALGIEVPRLGKAGRGAGGEALLTTTMSGQEAIQTAARDSRAAQALEQAKVNGQLQAQTVEQVVSMARANPQETADVIRAWIQEG